MAKATVIPAPETGVSDATYEGAHAIDIEHAHLIVRDEQYRTLATWAPGSWIAARLDDEPSALEVGLLRYTEWLAGVPSEDERTSADLVADFLAYEAGTTSG